MPFGFTGKELEVDLASGIVKKNYSNIEHYKKFLGGRGIATKIFIERISPDTHPFSQNNPLIFSTGLQLCITSLKIFIICYNVLFSETPSIGFSCISFNKK